MFEKYTHVTEILPAMGYGDTQMADLSATIDAVPCDSVLVATPIDLGKLIRMSKPATRVRYELDEQDRTVLPRMIREAIERRTARKTDPSQKEALAHAGH